MDSSRTRVVLADDVLLREGLASLLDRWGLEVAGQAGDAAGLLELVAARRAGDPLGVLTGREREVLALMAEGRSNAGIGQALWVTIQERPLMEIRSPGSGPGGTSSGRGSRW